MNTQNTMQNINKLETPEEKMKIVGFNASPRKKGNTAWSVNKILEATKEAGAITDLFSFNDLDIKPCQSCNGCKQGNRQCVIKDDMKKVYEALEHADALVLGMPIYMGQMSAQAKIFIDRLYADYSPRFSPFFKKENAGKKLVLLFTQGNPNVDMFKVYFDYTKNMFQMLEFDVKGVYVVANTRSEPAHERADLDTIMSDIGSLLVEK